jgi:PAS domain S-box-containing protein
METSQRLQNLTIALRDSEEKFSAIINTVADGIITLRAGDGLIETTNRAAEQMFGYSAEGLTGSHFGLLIPEFSGDNHNDSLLHYAASEEARAKGVGREVMGRRQNGSLFPLEIVISEMRLGGQRYFTGLLRDITLRKQAETTLLDEGALQRAIINSANFSSIATDAKGVIQLFNVGAERMLGYAAEDVVDKITPAAISDTKELIARAAALSIEHGSAIAPGFEALVFKASRGLEDIYELTYIRKNGSRLPAVVSVTALHDATNTIIGYLLIGTDNTARKLVEAERALLDQALKDKNGELEIAKSAAEKANLAKSDFLSSMSHELRTPLSAILGFAQLIESSVPPPTPPQARSVEQILKAGWYLLELINEILDLALIESGKLLLSMEPMSLAEVMLECQMMIEPQAQERGISVVFPMLQVEHQVKADRTRVKQVLINLLSNAIKYNREHGTVAVTCVASSSGRIRVAVEDSGEGLSAEKLAQLFEPFNRLGKETGVEEGTGIGLVVSRRLVDLMGGEIGATSVVGVGSVFWIELDSSDVALIVDSSIAPDEPAATRKPIGLQHTLLYVEDNPANLMLVEDLIGRRSDIRLIHARDGIRGVEMALKFLPDVVLMDINLPGISGMQALQVLAQQVPHIPVVALSANALPRDIEKGLNAGFFRYLTKPIKINEFMTALDETLAFVKTQTALALQVEPTL